MSSIELAGVMTVSALPAAAITMHQTDIHTSAQRKQKPTVRDPNPRNNSVVSFGKRLAKVSILTQGFCVAAAISASAAGLVDHLKTDPEFTLFSAALEQSGLAELLGNGLEYTIFVPSDTALKNEGMAFLLGNVLLTESNQTRLTILLSYHIVPGQRLGPETITGRVELATLSYEPLTVVRAGEALRVATDSANAIVTRKVDADDGVIFVIDRLIWPNWQTWPEDPVAVASQ